MCTLGHRMVQKELSTKVFWYKSWAQAVIGGSPKSKKTGWQEACRGDGGYGGGTKALTANSSFLAPTQALPWTVQCPRQLPCFQTQISRIQNWLDLKCVSMAKSLHLLSLSDFISMLEGRLTP